jgi:hypothetical protein
MVCKTQKFQMPRCEGDNDIKQADFETMEFHFLPDRLRHIILVHIEGL